MAAPRQGLPVRLERAPHRGAAFALSNASKRARTRSIGSRSRGSLFIFRSSPAVAPLGPSLPCRRCAGTTAVRASADRSADERAYVLFGSEDKVRIGPKKRRRLDQLQSFQTG